MGGAVCSLLGMYISSGCRASVVASSLAFHPPDSFYEIAYDPSQNKMMVHFSDLLPEMHYDHLEVQLLTTKNGCKVPVFLLRHPQATETILYSHGNASDIGAMFIIYMLMARSLKVNIVAYDYTGYGASKVFRKRPTEHQTYIDIETVYAWCIENKIVQNPKKQLILYGQSVGSGPSTYLASKKPVAGLVLHSPILSGLRVVTPSRFLACFDIFPNIDRIRSVSCPVFILHGEEDFEVPFYHGTELYEAVPGRYQYPAWWVPQRGHNDILYNNEEEFIRRIHCFLEYVRKNSEKGGGGGESLVNKVQEGKRLDEQRILLSS